MNFISNKFKNLIEYNSGYTWSKEQENSKFVDGSVRVLTVTNIQENLDLRSELYLTHVTEKDRERKAASKGWSIAVSSNGNRKRIGNAVFINDDTDYLFASFLIGFIPKDPDTILPKYFFYWLSSHPIQERITSVSEGTTGLGNLDIRFLRNMDLEYPKDPSEQTAIAGIISKVDEAIEAVENSIKSAERLKKSLMQNLLTGKLKPDGTWRSEDEFFVDEKYGKVPKGWEVKPLKELATIQRGKFSYRPRNEPRFYGGDHPFVQTSDVVKSIFYLKQYSQTLSDLGVTVSRKFNKGTIIITIAANIGDVAIANFDVFFPDSLIGINPFDDKIDTKFLLLSLLSKKPFLNQVATESAQKNINYSNLRPLTILHPIDITEQSEVAKRVEEVFEIIERKQAKINSLYNLKKSLMQNLLTGKVRVDVEKINKLLEEE
ncbi:MAG: hypothetical protein A2Y31_06705 [Spirochaetes bacterium GWC2_52_13]|nr:MAG: hypothetical protein A2Y31_06705 [Spirochaetes bacterium GWC2_52_13]